MQLLDSLPLWAVYLLIVVIAILVVEGGFYLGRYWAAHGRGAKDGQVKQQNVGALVGSSLALLAFLLVFMTGIASTRFDTRRQLVIAEANAIGTTYLRTSFLDEPERTAMRDLLREYVDLRLDTAADPAILPQARARSEAIHAELWSQIETPARAYPESTTLGLLIEALNNTIDLHTERMVAISNRFPLSNWLAIFYVAGLTLLMLGFNDGLTDGRNLAAHVALILIFAAVILLMVDLNRPQEGLLQVSQQALIDLQQQIRLTAP